MSRFVEMEGMDGTILVEIDDNELTDELSLVGSKNIFSPLSTFLSKVVSNGKSIIEKTRELSPDAFEMEFGIKGGIETGSTVWGLAKAVGEGNIKVKLKWDKKKDSKKNFKEESAMTENYESFINKFRTSELLIAETEYWRWSLRPVQVTLGAGILSLKRAAEHFSEIDKEESADLEKIVGIIERTLSDAFSYSRINYLMLMMVDYHVHFHVIPRYSESVMFDGESWEDTCYPKPVPISGNASSDEVLCRILDSIKKHL